MDQPREIAPGVFTSLTREQQERGMRNVIIAAVTGTLFFQALLNGGPLILYARRLGAGDVIIGLLTAVIQICVILQVPLAREVEARGKKRMLVPGIVLSVVFALPMVFLRYLPETPGLRPAVLLAAVGLLAVMRQPVLVSWMPLLSDVVPDDERGRFFGRMRTVWHLAALSLALVIAAAFGERSDWWQFQALFSVGILAYLVRLPFVRRIPELAPHPRTEGRSRLSFYRQALRDRSFMIFLAMLGIAGFMNVMMGPFTITYMEDILVYRHDLIVFAATALPILGGILTLMLWGHLADRIGNHAIFAVTLIGTAVTRLVWPFVAPDSTVSVIAVCLSLFFRGLLLAGFGIAATRYLYNALPADNKSGYVSTYTMAAGVATGLGPLLGGLLLAALPMRPIASLGLDRYQILFGFTGLGALLPLLFLARLKKPDEAPAREFLSFLISRPLRTTVDIVLYHRPLDEDRRAAVTRRLAGSTSAVTLLELLEGLDDPSYEVRQEAAHGLAARPQPEVVEALLAKLSQPDSLIRPSVIWALGELGREEAAEPLVRLLDATDRHARAQAALALGKIGSDAAVQPLLARWADESDRFVWACLATALGRLGRTEFLPGAVRALSAGHALVVHRQLATAAGALLSVDDDFYHVLRSELRRRGSAVRRLVRRALPPRRRRPDPAAADDGGPRRLREIWQAYQRRQDDRVLDLASRDAGPPSPGGDASAAVIVLRELAAARADAARPATHEEALLALVAACARRIEAANGHRTDP